MLDRLKPYISYKDSGVPWLGMVPEHWSVQRLRNLADMRVSNVDKHSKDDEQPVRLCNYVDVYKNDHIWPRMGLMLATATKDEIERFRLAEGDVLITKDSEAWNDIGVPALVRESADDLISGYHLALLRPFQNRIAGEFLFRSLQSIGVQYQFHVEANGVTRYGLSHAAIKSVWLPAPPLPEQAAIVRFLDYMDRRIRRYIRAKQKLIKLLEEQKQAIIHSAVTRGLDPNVRLKPSGVEWLGNVPEHWEIRRLRYLIEGKLIYGANVAAEHVNPKWPRYLRITDFGIHGLLRSDTFRSLPPEIAKDYLVQSGDILLARSGATVGKAFLVSSDIGQACHAGYLIRARPRQTTITPEFLFAFTQSAGFNRWKDSTFIIATIQNIGADKYADLFVPLPSLREQRTIIDFLKKATVSILAGIERAHREIDLLREYRTRLIADVVTGKLDVREAAARLPDEADEPELMDDSADAMTDIDEEISADPDATEGAAAAAKRAHA